VLILAGLGLGLEGAGLVLGLGVGTSGLDYKTAECYGSVHLFLAASGISDDCAVYCALRWRISVHKIMNTPCNQAADCVCFRL